VKTGDLLAEIDTPDIDAQTHQAEADLATAQANDQLAQTTLKRWQILLKTNSVSKQDVDDKAGAAAADDALVAAAQANLDRLKQLEDFKHVIAPFDGVITARNTDVGALINAGSGSAAGQELFHIAETDKLRIYIQVPENYTSAITPDIAVDLYFPAYPQRAFPATLARTADAIDPATRTLLIELEVDNAKGEMMSGGYAEAHIKLTASGGNVRLPVSTLLFRDGMQAATIDGDSHVVLKRITIGRDYGKSVEVLSGISAGEKVIVNPPDSLDNGQEVRTVSPNDGNDDSSNGKKDDDKE
jgi:RND family efflux transporter MFP subunit